MFLLSELRDWPGFAVMLDVMSGPRVIVKDRVMGMAISQLRLLCRLFIAILAKMGGRLAVMYRGRSVMVGSRCVMVGAIEPLLQDGRRIQ